MAWRVGGGCNGCLARSFCSQLKPWELIHYSRLYIPGSVIISTGKLVGGGEGTVALKHLTMVEVVSQVCLEREIGYSGQRYI